MGYGIGLGAASNGFLRGYETMSRINANEEDRAYRRERDAKMDERWDKNFQAQQDINARKMQSLDLADELSRFKLDNLKDEKRWEQGKRVSKVFRAAMSKPDGTILTRDEFEQLPQEDQMRRMDNVHRSANWLVNTGGLLKGYFASNPSINPDKPVAGFQLMHERNSGRLGVLTHLNRKDGQIGGLDFPNRRDGEATVMPVEAFMDVMWNATSIYDDGSMSERQKAQFDRQTKLDVAALKNQGKDSRTSMAKNIDYLVSNGLAGNKQEAFKHLQTAKSNPVKFVGDYVQQAEENQIMFNIRPGDPRHRSREQIIHDAKSMLGEITGQLGGWGQPAQAQPVAPQQQPAPTHGVAQQVSDADLQFTAQKYGMTVEQVKQKLGLQ